MGLFDMLSKEKRQKGALERNIKKVTNKHAQSEDRMAAMDALAKDGSEEALGGLLKRFTFLYDKLSVDETEKEWVTDRVTAAGEKAIPALEKYLYNADAISYALNILEKVADHDKLLAVVDELCRREGPEYTRDPGKKVQLLTWLGDSKLDGAEVGKRLVPYLGDFDETVRFAAIDTLDHKRHESARLPLLDAILKPDEESRRIKKRAAEVAAAAGWSVAERKDALVKLCAAELPEVTVAGDKLVIRT
jgi:HEAT repeat protein